MYHPAQMADTTADGKPNVDEKDSPGQVRLWVEYVRSQNERRLQSHQRSGLTNYALAAVLAGLLYRFVPQVPRFVASPEFFGPSLVIFAVEVDAAFYLLCAYGILIYFCSGVGENRIQPQARRRVNDVVRWAIVLVGFAIGLFHIWIGVWLAYPSDFVKWAVIGLGFWWLANMFLATRNEIRTIRRARRHKILRPRFTAMTFPPNWEALIYGVALALIGVFALAVLIVFAHQLEVNWVSPLGAASIFNAFGAICVVLIWRGLARATEGTYDTLERDIVLYQLDSEQIKERFVRQTLGADAVAWLDELLAALKQGDDELRASCDSVRQRLQEVEAIDPSYVMERKGRRDELAKQLREAMQHNKDNFAKFRFQLELFLKECRSWNSGEEGVLKRWTEAFKTQADESSRVFTSAGELVEALKNMQFK